MQMANVSIAVLQILCIMEGTKFECKNIGNNHPWGFFITISNSD